MSKADGVRHWRQVRCGGCEKQCRYDQFHVFPGLRRGEVFQVVIDILKGTDGHHRKGTILGTLHAMKREAWERETRACQAALEQLHQLVPTC
jgi:hypothetical protein